MEPCDIKADQITIPKVEAELLTQEHKDLIEEQQETIKNLQRKIYILKVKEEPNTNFDGKMNFCVCRTLEMDFAETRLAKFEEKIEFMAH